MSQKTSSKSALQDTLDMLEGARAFKAHVQQEEEKRQVNIRLPIIEFELLEMLSEHYEEARTSMAQHLLQAAIHDAAASLGIQHPKFKD